ncbi:hypothetical protein Taro_044360 [Colocasia esculenta]|uniref:Uncharacterized protein n=1 Tax=Colocasia esculenta TaxID=4460 RepID=A0A843X2J9_COLES|nr:hypothetical protein [Colocasia esculenta]
MLLVASRCPYSLHHHRLITVSYMTTSLDMSLEDRIKNRNSSERGRGRGRGRGWVRGRGGTSRGRAIGMLHQGSLRVNTRPSAYKTAKASLKSLIRAKDMIWRHDLFHDSMVAAGLTGVESGTKLYVSNLDYGVSNEDIKEQEIRPVFGDDLLPHVSQFQSMEGKIGGIGPESADPGSDRSMRIRVIESASPICSPLWQQHLMGALVVTDSQQHDWLQLLDLWSLGSAEVIFVRRSDALAALKRYNNVQLDGKAMKIEIIGSDIGLPVSARVQVGVNGRGRRTLS